MMPALNQKTDVPTREFAINAMTGHIREAAEKLPDEIAKMSVHDLEAERTPTEIDYYLRRNLWKQIDLVKSGAIQVIEPESIYAGVCSRQNFDQLTRYPKRVAWLLIYPADTDDRLEAGLSIGLTNMLKFVSKEPTAETANAFMKAIEMLLNRVKGPIIQKIQAQHAHLNMNKPIEKAIPVHDRLSELKDKLQPMLDVTPKEEK